MRACVRACVCACMCRRDMRDTIGGQGHCTSSPDKNSHCTSLSSGGFFLAYEDWGEGGIIPCLRFFFFERNNSTL